MSFTLRPYQSDALATLWDYLRHREGNPALVLPTGAGKSPLMAAIAEQAATEWNGRVMILAHVQELVEQNAAKFAALAPHLKHGIYAAGLRRRDRFEQILFCQIQSVAKRAASFPPPDLLLIDEAHRIPLGAKGEGLYRQFIADLRRFNPRLRVVGLTATPYRLQGRAVPVCGPDNVLTEVAYEARVGDLIRDGYLSPLVSRAGERPDLGAVHLRGGEYIEGELAAAMLPLVERTAADLLARSEGRRAGIVFCVNVEHAEAVLSSLRARGEAAALVHGGTPKGERADLIRQFQSGDTRWMVNVNVLSEGFDAPHIDCVAMLRPTKSPGLYYQQVGRGFRLAEGKTDCLVLDYAGNVLEHGPVDAIKVQPARPGRAAEVTTARAKECPKCSAILPIGVRVCECGFSFASGDPAHLDRPIDAPVLSSDRPRVLTRHDVHGVQYMRHVGASKIPTMRVTYACGLRRIHEYICLEHAGMARAKALRWWVERAGPGDVPRTVEAALERAYELPRPVAISVDETNKHPEILSYEWPAERSGAGEVVERSAPDSASAGIPAGADPVRSVRGVPGWLLRAVEGQRAA